jgi:hypothetical protein
MDGNVYLKGAKPSKHEAAPLVLPDFDPALKIVEKPDGWYLELNADTQWAAGSKRRIVTTALLGKAVVPNQPFENPDGTPVKVDTDYSGRTRNETNPFPGPFEITESGKQKLRVWPMQD